MEIKDKELHRIVTTAIIYKPDFTWITAKQVDDYDFIDGIDQEIRNVDNILKKLA